MINETSTRLKQNLEKIMRIWEKQARKEVPAARRQGTPELRDDLPSFLSNLAIALDPRAGNEDACEDSGVSKAHGAERALLPGYALDQVIHEYKILRTVIFDVLEAEAPLNRKDRDIIFDSILSGISDASTEFIRMQTDSRENFVLTLSHDMRSPLTAIKASANLLQRHFDKPELVGKYASRIVDNVNRTDDMIRDLLDVHRVRVGERLPLELGDCNLANLAREVCHELATIHGERFTVRADDEVMGFWGCEALRRALENLLSNAVKYGSPNAEIVVTVVSKAKERVRVEVLNHGNPISPEDIASLFEMHRRTAAAQTSGKQGWGLGLTLVRGVAEAHGGAVTVKSSEKEGTTFVLDIPMDARPYQPRK